MRRLAMVIALIAGVLEACGSPTGTVAPRPVVPPAAPVPTPQPSDDPYVPPAAGTSLEVLTYNTWGKPGILGTKTKERYQRLRTALGQFDWVTLQEAFSNEAGQLQGLPGYPFTFWQSDGAFLKINSGLFTLSRHPILARDFSPFKDCTHSDCLSRKGVIWTRLQVAPGLNVDVFNTHYQAEDDETAEQIRVRDNNKVLSDFVKAHNQGNPTFIQGDFNFLEGKQAYTDLKRRLPLHDLWRETKPEDPGYSFDPTLNPNLGGKGPQQRLDYLFFVDNERYDANVEGIELAYTTPVNGLVLSDHFAVRTKLQVVAKGRSAH